MEIVLILNWIKNNWKLIVGALIVLIIAALFAYTFSKGYDLGKANQLATDQKVIDGIHDAAQAAQDKLQAAANTKAQEYETARTNFKSKLDTAKKQLTKAEIINHAFNTCHAGNDYVELYKQLAGQHD